MCGGKENPQWRGEKKKKLYFLNYGGKKSSIVFFGNFTPFIIIL